VPTGAEEWEGEIVARNTSSGFGAALLVLASAGAACAQQEDVAAFYTGKTVRIVVGVGVGSGYDINARVVARHIGNHIPGKPQIVVQNQPGAGSLTMTHALYNVGPKDGTAIGASHQGIPAAHLMTPEQVKFDPLKINWLGSTNRETQVTYSWHSVPIKSIEDIRKTKFVVGSQAPGSSQNDFPVTLNRLFGFNFSVVNGYEATAKIHLAMERGEVHGIAAVNWSSLLTLQPKWIEEKKVNIIGQFAMRPHPDLKSVPMWLDIAKTPADRQAMELLLSRLETGRPFFLPPDVPAVRVNALRRAFDATMKDPAFIAEASKAKLEVDPMTGEELAAFVVKLNGTPPDIVARVREAMAGK
jgi:tripartite-type tricarboxylate transporter receptor subunit TctC